MSNEWLEWHKGYETNPTMASRLRTVQALIRAALDACPAGRIRLVSACAGDGRDVLGALIGHPRAPDVEGRLVDLTPELVAAGRARFLAAGFPRLELLEGDASVSDAFLGAVPAHVVVFCGVFGNLRDGDVHRTIDLLPELCAARATVIWTRGRFAPDLTPSIRRWFAGAGFAERSFRTLEGSTMSVGAHELLVPPRPLRPGVRWFTFLPYEERPSTVARCGPPAGPPANR